VTEPHDRIAAATSLLFVRGHRPDRFDKAASTGAELVIIDLADAVAAEGKDSARNNAAAWLAPGNRAVVRINPPGTPWSESDLTMAAGHGSAVMVPKAEDPAVITELAARTAGRCALVPLVETVLGVERAHEVCATPGVARAAFGNVDLAAELGVTHDDHTALAHARSRLVLAPAAAGIGPPIDGVTTAVRDREILHTDTAHARRLGFSGKLCIHPCQLSYVASGFAPTADELRWARAVLGAGEWNLKAESGPTDASSIGRAPVSLTGARGPISCAANSSRVVMDDPLKCVTCRPPAGD